VGSPGDSRSLDEAIAALRAVMTAFEVYRDAVSGYLGLSVNEARAITHLYGSDGIGQAELGQRLAFDTATVSAIVDSLELSGVAERTRHPADHRLYTVRLTTQGLEMLRLSGEWLAEAFDHVDLAAQAALIPGLVAISENLRDRTAQVRLNPSSASRPRSWH
jgi:DNA-binding MarR family transcriptional regulator